MKVEIIDKTDIPEGRIRWRHLLNSLTYDKAIKKALPSKGIARRKRNSIRSNFRKTNLDNSEEFKVCTQIAWVDGQWSVFIWKEKDTEWGD